MPHGHAQPPLTIAEWSASEATEQGTALDPAAMILRPVIVAGSRERLRWWPFLPARPAGAEHGILSAASLRGLMFVGIPTGCTTRRL